MLSLLDRQHSVFGEILTPTKLTDLTNYGNLALSAAE